jgi:hypothetical protein
MRKPLHLVFAALVLCSPAPAAADQAVPQPAEAAKKKDADKERAGEEEPSWRTHSYDAPPVYETTVHGKPVPKDEQLIGDYAQPRWTARRRFPTTRVYVRPRGSLGVEYWLESKFNLEDKSEQRYSSQYEFEMGLGHRLQLDFYLTTEQNGFSGPLALASEKLELRYAFADWGVIPTNPTIYLEWIHQHEGPQKAEAKLLFGGPIVERWFWGANLVCEQELDDEHETEMAVTGAVARTIVDERFSLGLEVKGEMVRVDEQDFPASYEVLAGPSIQWTPVGPVHIDLVLLFGFETERGAGASETIPLAEPLLVIGYEI